VSQDDTAPAVVPTTIRRTASGRNSPGPVVNAPLPEDAQPAAQTPRRTFLSSCLNFRRGTLRPAVPPSVRGYEICVCDLVLLDHILHSYDTIRHSLAVSSLDCAPSALADARLPAFMEESYMEALLQGERAYK